jgi:predicted PurR-regulated permease PerM
VLYFAGLAAWNQLSGAASEMPQFKEHLSDFISGVTGKFQEVEDTTARLLTPARKPAAPAVTIVIPRPAPRVRGRVSPPVVETPGRDSSAGTIPEVRIHQDSNRITDYVYARLGTLYEFLIMASFVPFLVYFMLSWRDHIYRSFLRFFDGGDRITAARSLEGVAGMARAFVVGNFMIGVLLTTLGWAAFALLHIPYPFLVGVLSGFLSLVPYAGMPLAVAPPILACLAGGVPSTVIFFALVSVLSLHLAAMNVFYPKLVGARVHLNPLVVTFALMFWGFLWDAAGLVLAIPITAGIKAVCDNVAGLRPWGRFLGD